MKIVIFGSGGVGGYFGGRFAQAGLDVTFIARGRHLDAMLNQGLAVESLNGDFSIQPVSVVEKPEAAGDAGVVLCCVKSWQVRDAAVAMRPIIGPDTVVITLQNGVEAHTTAADILGQGHVLPGLCRIISMVAAPGVIRHIGADPYLAFGEMGGGLSARLESIQRHLSQADGVAVDISPNILPALWKKLMLIAPWGGVGAVTRAPIGVMRSVPETRAMLNQAIQEVCDVASANGIAMDEGAVETTQAFVDKLPADGTASMQRDIMEGRPSELKEQTGGVLRFAESTGVHVPVHECIYKSLLPQELRARRKIQF